MADLIAGTANAAATIIAETSFNMYAGNHSDLIAIAIMYLYTIEPAKQEIKPNNIERLPKKTSPIITEASPTTSIPTPELMSAKL